jgi:uncharacterized protein YkwD
MSVTSVLRALLAAFMLGCIVAPAGASASARHDRTETSIIRAINDARAAHDLARLSGSRGLARAADAHSASMARTHSIAHGSYRTRVRRYVRSRRVGENVAWVSRCDAAAVVRMWLRSATHRRVILSRSFRRIGVAKRSARLCYVTADFATAT